MPERNHHLKSKRVKADSNNNNNNNNDDDNSNSTNLTQSTHSTDSSTIRQSSPFNDVVSAAAAAAAAAAATTTTTVVAVVVDDSNEFDSDDCELSILHQQQQQQQDCPRPIAIPLGSGSDTSSSSDSDSVTSSSTIRIVTKKKKDQDTTTGNTSSSSNPIMNQVRQRRNFVMNTLSRWDSSSSSSNKKTTDKNKKTTNSQYNSSVATVVQQQGTTTTTNNTSTGNNTNAPASITTPSFSQTLVISIASMCLVSLCTTMVWMFQVPIYMYDSSSGGGSYHHQSSSSSNQMIPSAYDTTTTTGSSSTYRPPPLLSVGGGANFFIDPDTTTTSTSTRRLDLHKVENNDPTTKAKTDMDEDDDKDEEYDINHQKQFNTNNNNNNPKKIISFRNIAQRGSIEFRIYNNNRQSDIVDVKSDGEVVDNKNVDLHIELGRSTRFPSVDQRVRVYMSNWYLPPCPSIDRVDNNNNNDAFVEYNVQINPQDGIEYMVFREARTFREKKRGVLRTFLIDDTTNFDVLRHLNYHNMEACAQKSSYCKDFMKYLYPAMDRAVNNTSIRDGIDVRHINNNVLMYQFSDAEKTRAYNIVTGKINGYPNVPNLKKFRYSISKEERERILSSNSDDNRNCMVAPRPIPITILQQQMLEEGEKILPTSQPIIMKLKIQRHYGYVERIPDLDIDWTQKKNQAIFRGQFTGRFPVGMNTATIKDLPVMEQCNLLHRCRLVYNAALNMKLIDAKLALPVLDVRKDFPQVINDVALYGDRVSIEDMLKYKAIIMLEGNDVSSGLKWALYSNSVVMTQTPTKTSWAMEELLEPWIHYVPLNEDLSDVEEKMQWIIDHDDEAQRIAYRGKLWIHDLVFHADAATDEAAIFDDILRRTKAHYILNTNLEVPMVDINVEK